jgi:hypothetical protein
MRLIEVDLTGHAAFRPSFREPWCRMRAASAQTGAAPPQRSVQLTAERQAPVGRKVRCLKWVRFGRCGYVGRTAGVPKADDLLQCSSRQSRAINLCSMSPQADEFKAAGQKAAPKKIAVRGQSNRAAAS